MVTKKGEKIVFENLSECLEAFNVLWRSLKRNVALFDKNFFTVKFSFLDLKKLGLDKIRTALYTYSDNPWSVRIQKNAWIQVQIWIRIQWIWIPKRWDKLPSTSPFTFWRGGFTKNIFPNLFVHHVWGVERYPFVSSSGKYILCSSTPYIYNGGWPHPYDL